MKQRIDEAVSRYNLSLNDLNLDRTIDNVTRGIRTENSIDEVSNQLEINYLLLVFHPTASMNVLQLKSIFGNFTIVSKRPVYQRYRDLSAHTRISSGLECDETIRTI